MLKQAFFKISLLLIPFYLLSIAAFSQQKYWLEFNLDEKNATENQITLLKSALQEKYKNEIEFHYHSKWTHAVSILTSEQTVECLRALAFVKDVTPQKQLQPLSLNTSSKVEYSYALEQIKASYLTDSLGLSGKKVKIGVIDGGFMDADEEPSLKHLIANQQIKFFKDYLLKDNKDTFYGRKIAYDEHGSQVLQMIAGIDEELGIKYGLAPNAHLYLARTDHGIREKRIEEDYWVEAIELFYEMGIRLVNSSLGYTNTFDKRKENHSKKEVDGKSTMITRTAQAAAEKGMLIVSAAGNDGHAKWEILSVPSDAKDVLTVGAVRFDDWSKIYYSSVGPEILNYVKPDVACFAAEGTSFSAPIITGLAACIWEYDSTLSNIEVIDIIKSASHLYENPNNYIGYGIPDSEKIRLILKQKRVSPILQKRVTDQDYIEIQIREGIKKVVIFHKSDSVNVIEQSSVAVDENQTTMRIDKIKRGIFTTVSAQDKLLVEIKWD